MICGGSPLTKSIENCIHFDQNEAVIVADISDQDVTHRLSLKLAKPLQKWGFLDQQPIRSYRKIQTQFPVLFLSSDIIYAFRESPQVRRQNLDHFCGLLNSEFTHISQKYAKILRQKNRMLKETPSPDMIRFWNSALVECAHKIVSARKEGLHRIQAQYRRLTEGTEFHSNLSLIYDQEETSYHAYLSQKFEDNIDKEIQAGVTLYGPHREDYQVNLDNRSVFEFFSRGINKSTAFLMTLAQMEAVFEMTHQYPILLLDDTFSEMDTQIKHHLVELIEPKCQLLYTTVLDQDQDLFKTSKAMHMKDGVMQEVSKGAVWTV